MSKPTQTQSVTLSEPIEVDGKTVSEVSLRKPMAGELRGLNMLDVLRMDVSAMIKLLPRITQPPLTELQVSSQIEPDDFTELASKTVVFFAKPGQLQLES
ncbi:MAG: phage tail assembly protein [Ruegeria sp.]|uniref:phage tail assembly protein n=1 Tax=Ruegeria sp. TaxID=1879320 RepID=UPI00349EF7D5